MKKKYACIFTAIVISVGCNSKKQETCTMQGGLNPNGSSELSLIMRKMAAHLAENRDALKAGKGIVDPPKEIENLLTAKKTDEDIDTTIFNAYARIYQQRTNELIQSAGSSDSLKIRAHNNLVSTCRDCHSNFCAGPMKLINQLDIK